LEKIIKNINDSDLFVRIIEVGAGVPISNEIFNYSGASKTIYSSESYYSRDAYKNMFGESKNRAVSAERLKEINDNTLIIKDLNNGLYNTVLSTTFQVGDTTNKVSTHGWICLNINNDNIRYYHISLHNANSRKEYIKQIGEIGVLLLNSKNENIPTDCFVDIVLDKDLQPLYNETLNFLSNNINTDIATVFTYDSKIDRLESITRDVDNLIIYKGSFNPPSVSHLDLMNKTISLYENNKAVYCISLDTYQKGYQNLDSILERINMLNILGFSVLITSKPLFKDTYDLLRLKFGKNIVFPQGMDTFNRIINSGYTVDGDFKIDNFIKDFKNVDMVVYNRGDEKINCEEYLNLLSFVKIVEVEDNNVSSTLIRKLIDENKYEEVEKYLHPLIFEKLKNK
jgi:nicotinic acid mononucleotide adenylyltransferase